MRKHVKAAQAKIATMLTEFKTQPAEQVVAKNKVAFESAGVFTRSQGLNVQLSVQHLVFLRQNQVCGL